jgi:uncharacterized DUF497 family protein
MDSKKAEANLVKHEVSFEEAIEEHSVDERRENHLAAESNLG